VSGARPCIFGEVLFDHFPDGRHVLGGAPFNVAWHLQAFGQSPCLISRVGQDAEGEAVRAAMQAWGMDTGALQSDPQRPTGRVDVSFQAGEPTYDIVPHCAYDAIEPPPALPDCRLFYHGSLALREVVSRESAQRIVAGEPGLVFVDVNLRPPWWQQAQVLEWVRAADWVKLNADELALLAPRCAADDAGARQFAADCGLAGLIVTRGASGAEIVTAGGEQLCVQPTSQGEVVDTVGAGDAFAAVVILGLLREWPLQTTLQRAVSFAARIVERRGATVDDPLFYQPFVEAWQLAT
jgi:fructokinase